MRIFFRQTIIASALLCLSLNSWASPNAGPQTPSEQKLGEICAVNGALPGQSPLSGLITDICSEQAALASGYSCECRKSAVGAGAGIAAVEPRCHSDSVKECAKNCSKAECKECCGTFTNVGNNAFLRCMDGCCGGMGKYDENYRCTDDNNVPAN